MNERSRRTVLVGGVVVATALAGCLDSGTDSQGGAPDTTRPETTATSQTTTGATTTEELVNDDEPLELRNVKFSETKPTGYREVDSVNAADFQHGQSVYVYFEPRQVTRRRLGDDEVEYSLTADVAIRDESESEVTSFTSDIAETRAASTDFSEFWAYQEVNIVPDFPTGHFDLELTVTDDLTGDERTRTLTFAVLDDTQNGDEYVETFRQVLADDDEFTGTIDRLAVDADDVVRLRVNTTAEAETEAWRGDIGYIAGVYAALIDEGWETTRLVTIIESADGASYRFVVEREDCLAWMNDDISTEEFLARIMDTLEEV